MCGAGSAEERQNAEDMMQEASDECKLAQRLTDGYVAFLGSLLCKGTVAVSC